MAVSFPTYRLELVVTEGGASHYPPVGFKEVLSDQNAGYDVKVVVDQEPTLIPTLVPLGLKARMVRMIPFGVNKEIVNEEDSHFTLEPRSSIYKSGFIMANTRGIIDKSYRGELKAPVVSLFNGVSKKIEAGTRLFQILAPELGHIESVEFVSSLPETVRGEGGFGSTGLK
jgi:dUTPase